ncbi:major intrinsic protein [Bifidobacterium margollesii]|uniref:Major intrinsic protein n=1 Tax=Bifidobacterium margollesii TaxID=2020964 RepID=A0A2N5J9P7_9BIFI|nr:aquaporin [Bifidobacterium margollesii]PLS30939.1 major intrinsic protein [Bifidobacterium margollesii]
MSEPNIPAQSAAKSGVDGTDTVNAEVVNAEVKADQNDGNAASPANNGSAVDSKAFTGTNVTETVRRAGAEFAGSFFVCFALFAASTYGTVLYGANAVFVAVVAALAYGTATAVFARFSGGHFNPAVTLAAALTSRIGWIDALAYLVAQLLGGIVAGALLTAILPTSENVEVKVWLASAVNGFGEGSPSNSMLSQAGVSFSMTMAIVMEVAMGLLVVAAAMSTLNKDGSATDHHAAVTGMAYGVASAITFPITGAGLNPVRSTGIALFAQGKGLTVEPLQQLWVFWVCPLLAGAVVALVMLLSDTMRQKAESVDADGNGTTAEAIRTEQEETYVDADFENSNGTNGESAPEGTTVKD